MRIPAIWEKLRSLYDLKTLDERVREQPHSLYHMLMVCRRTHLGKSVLMTAIPHESRIPRSDYHKVNLAR